MKRIAIICALALVALTAAASAKNVDLSTLPNRDSVQLTIYNSEDITLVKETRYLTFKQGPNRMQFSWAGTLIDPSSVEIRPLTHAGEIEVADTVFPGQKPQHLILQTTGGNTKINYILVLAKIISHTHLVTCQILMVNLIPIFISKTQFQNSIEGYLPL